MNTEPDLTLVIPAYNEEKALPLLLTALEEPYGSDPEVEVIVIDDGSTDGTAAAVEAFDWVRLLRHPYNKGNGAAVKTGLRAARGRVGVILDADGQHPPEVLTRLVDQVQHYDLVVGARTAESDSTRFRDLGNWMLSRLATYLVRSRIPDLTSGLRAFRMSMMRAFIHLYPNQFSLPSTSTMCFLASGYSVRFEPIAARRRQHGSSSIRPWRDGMRFVAVIVRLVMLFNPNRVFLPLALLLFAVGTAWGAHNLATRQMGLSVGALLFMLSGVIIAVLGVLADMLAQILRQLNQPSIHD